MPADIYDRDLFNRRLREELARSARYGHEFCLAVLEAHGGTNGMSVQEKMQVGESILTRALRTSDIAGRVFEDTLAAVLVETGHQGATDAMHRIAARLANRTGPWHITLYFFPAGAEEIEAQPFLSAA
jgi:GGDEF domain-containing protein